MSTVPTVASTLQRKPELDLFSAQLGQVEQCLQTALASLLARDEVKLEAEFTRLRNAMLQLNSARSELKAIDRALLRRVNRVGRQLDDLGQALARSNAMTQQQLKVLFPQPVSAVYGHRGTSMGSGRTNAAFTSVSA